MRRFPAAVVTAFMGLMPSGYANLQKDPTFVELVPTPTVPVRVNYSDSWTVEAGPSYDIRQVGARETREIFTGQDAQGQKWACSNLDYRMAPGIAPALRV